VTVAEGFNLIANLLPHFFPDGIGWEKDAIQGEGAQANVHHGVRIRNMADCFCSAWSRSPIRLVAPASGDHDLFASSRSWWFVMTLWVLKVNRFAARTTQVEPGQQVISSGPYRIVRHPMDPGESVMLLFTPWRSAVLRLAAFALLIPVIVLRLLKEEKVVRQELPGYAECCFRTRFRLVPLLW
jgi:hypothetical protein